MNFDTARLPLLGLVMVLLLGGGVVYVREGAGAGATALISAGLITLGAIISLEAIAWHDRMHKDDDR